MQQTRIRYLTQEEKPKTRSMYEEIFSEDSREFVDYYYTWKLRENEILVMEEETQLRDGYQVMLHLNPYELSINGAVRRIPYIVAVATHPACRRQGKMQQVMEYALQELAKKRVPFTFLMPADPAYYRGQGFVYFPNQEAGIGNSSREQRSCCLPFEKEREAGRERMSAEFQTITVQPCQESDYPELSAVSNELLQERYQIFVRRKAEYYRRLQAEAGAERGGILRLEAEGCLMGAAVYGIQESGESTGEAFKQEEKENLRAADIPMEAAQAQKPELRELLVPEIYKKQAKEAIQTALAAEELVYGDFPMMVRITCLEALVPLLRSKAPCCCQVRVQDSIVEENQGCYRIELSESYGRITPIPETERCEEIEMAELTLRLFGDTSVYLHEWV